MPPEHYERMAEIKAVEREYSAARLATDRLIAVAKSDPTILDRISDLHLRDIHRTSQHLEGTYIIRLFAEFETSLRHFWSRSKRREPPSRTRDLLDGVASTCKILDRDIQNAHSVREYRNALVHERDDEVLPISISVCRSYLCTFFKFLDRSWE
jgi:hypothetical protein